MRFILCLLVSCVCAYSEETGMVYVKSEPAGALISYESKDGLVKLNVKTPSLVKLPIALQWLHLTLEGYEEERWAVFVTKDVGKPEPYKLNKITTKLDIIFRNGDTVLDGWMIYIDGKPYLEREKPVIVPATVKVHNPAHAKIFLVKDGFVDIPVLFEGTRDIVVTDVPKAGKSFLLLKKPEVLNTDNLMKNLTSAVWDTLPGTVYTLKATQKELDINVVLDAGDFVVVPNC